MPAQGRKNVHGKTGVRFKQAYTKSKNENMLRTVVTQLVLLERVSVTKATSDELVPLADKLITLAKTNDLHARRQALAILRDMQTNEKEPVKAIDKLFNELGPRYKDRQGGYTRALAVQARRGDNAPMALVEFVK